MHLSAERRLGSVLDAILRGYVDWFGSGRALAQGLLAGIAYRPLRAVSIVPLAGVAADRRPGPPQSDGTIVQHSDAGPAGGGAVKVASRTVAGYLVDLDAEGIWENLTPRRGHRVHIAGSAERAFGEARLSSAMRISSRRRDTYQAASFLNRDQLQSAQSVEATTSDTLDARLQLLAPVAAGLRVIAQPDLTRPVAPDDAVAFLCDAARSVDDLHLVAVGPLTNVALALRRDPGLRSRLAGLTIMGGGAHAGNVTPVAEFNVWADPEAAAIVFSEAAPLTMVGLDVTHKVLLGGDEAARMRSAGTPAAHFAAGLLEYAYDRCREFGLEAAPVHDATAIIAVTHPHLFRRSTHPVAVELHGEHTRGMTVTDVRPPAAIAAEPAPPAQDVVWDADAAAVIDLIVQAVINT